MSEITHHKLAEYLESRQQSDHSEDGTPVYLLFGDEMLVEKAFTELLDALIPQQQRSFGYEPLDGMIATAADVIEHVNTYGLTQGLKVVAWRDARVFRPATDRKKLLTSARDALGDNEHRKAAGFFLKFLSSAKLGLDDVNKAERESLALPGLSGGSADDWVDELVAYCRRHDLKPTAGEHQAEAIKRTIESGLPAQHHLVITTDTVDRRHGLYKRIREKGVVIDCSVPTGSRRADRQAQEKALLDTMNAILKPQGKKMDRASFNTLCEKTGFDLRTFANNLDILINYVGARDRISADDVTAVLRRTKQDPVYELTNAVSDRNLDQALFYLDSLLAADLHPLQVLAALTNQFRRLLLAKDFVESTYGQAWFEGCPYNQFQAQVIPAMVAYDQELLETVDGWHRELSPADGSATGKSARAKKATPKRAGDLVLAKNPKNAYPLYLLVRKTDRFHKAELLEASHVLQDTDRHLKSTSHDPKLVLEHLILHLCRRRPEMK